MTESSLRARVAKLEAELACEVADRRALHDRYVQLGADIKAMRREHTGRVGGRVWTLYFCPVCKRHTTDSAQADCDCDVHAWRQVTVAPVPGTGLGTEQP